MGSGVALIARILLASIFIISGVRKILAFPIVAGMMAGKGFPLPEVFLGLAIALELAGGALLIANIMARPAALALAAFTLVSGAIFHNFWAKTGLPPPEYNSELNHFLKNVAIAGGLLMVAAVPTGDDEGN